MNEKKKNNKYQEYEEEEEERNEVESLEELDVQVYEPGQRAKAKITLIRRGKLGTLLNIDNIRDPRVRQRMAERQDRDAVQICFEFGGRQWCQTFLVSASPRSNIYRLVKKYGKLRVGSEVEITINNAGFPRIALD